VYVSSCEGIVTLQNKFIIITKRKYYYYDNEFNFLNSILIPKYAYCKNLHSNIQTKSKYNYHISDNKHSLTTFGIVNKSDKKTYYCFGDCFLYSIDKHNKIEHCSQDYLYYYTVGRNGINCYFGCKKINAIGNAWTFMFKSIINTGNKLLFVTTNSIQIYQEYD